MAVIVGWISQAPTLTIDPKDILHDIKPDHARLRATIFQQRHHHRRKRRLNKVVVRVRNHTPTLLHRTVGSTASQRAP
jgi:hypothetical protein